MFNTGPLYQVNRNPKVGKKIIINQGGTWSGKTFCILQVLCELAIIQSNQIITVVGQDLPNLKSGAIRDIKNIIRDSEELQRCIMPLANGHFYNESEKLVKFKSGSIIEFKSYSNEQDAKSGKRDYLFINEANGILYSIYKQLSLRTAKTIYLDYNPTVEFWAHDELIGLPQVQLIISDHRHNPFIPNAKHKEIEDLKYEDEELFKVYGRGLTGKLEGLVFRNWFLCDAIPEGATKVGTGLDFGFTNDPTALIDVYLQNGELWLHELTYQTGLTNPDIAKLIFDLKINNDVIADSAEPKSIKEIENDREYPFRKIEPADKGPDSVKNGIDILKRYKMNITRSSINLKKEFQSYKWKVDKSTGRTLNVPVDFKNHLIDPLRYVALAKLSNNFKPTKRPKYSLI